MILAIDPSAKACGWAVLSGGGPSAPHVEASGVWRPSRAAGAWPRLVQLAEEVAALCLMYSYAAIVIETDDPGPRYYRDKAGGRHEVSAQTYRTYGEAVGVVIGAAVAAAGADAVKLVPVRRWKGNAGKAASVFVAAAYLGRQPVDHNEADAVALGLSYSNGLPDPKKGPEWGRSRGKGYVAKSYARAVERERKR